MAAAFQRWKPGTGLRGGISSPSNLLFAPPLLPAHLPFLLEDWGKECWRGGLGWGRIMQPYRKVHVTLDDDAGCARPQAPPQMAWRSKWPKSGDSWKSAMAGLMGAFPNYSVRKIGILWGPCYFSTCVFNDVECTRSHPLFTDCLLVSLPALSPYFDLIFTRNSYKTKLIRILSTKLLLDSHFLQGSSSDILVWDLRPFLDWLQAVFWNSSLFIFFDNFLCCAKTF